MLEKTKKLITKNGYSNVDLKEGDARHLAFPGEAFDVLYNSFMLDLIPIADFPVVLKEFQRVLKSDGRLILVNLTKRDNTPVIVQDLYNKLYNWNPYLYGGCRPVFMESFVTQTGFRHVTREVPKTGYPAEIVTALK
jgi:demethylmenaquinone methyltransferase/2-methoxy-6-polyprenyl-1,4-benzoquinol methylase